MNRALVLCVLLAAWTGLAIALGWKLRDGSAEVATERVALAQLQRSHAATDARGEQTLANVRSATSSEQQRLLRQQQRRATDARLQQEIDQHEASMHARGRDRGDADPGFMRIWRAANAGQPPVAGESADRTGPAAAAASTARTGGR